MLWQIVLCRNYICQINFVSVIQKFFGLLTDKKHQQAELFVVREANITQINIFADIVTGRKLHEGTNALDKATELPA